ncbi:DUF427 domain-containing protein [Caballeronia glathei]
MTRGTGHGRASRTCRLRTTSFTAREPAHRELLIADTTRPLVLDESGFALPRYVPARTSMGLPSPSPKARPFCLYTGICSYYHIGDIRSAAWTRRRSGNR